MEDAEESPRDEGQPSQNDDPVPEEDQHYFDKLLLHLWSFLPFLTKVIDSSELLKIQPDQVPKLQYLYQLVDAKRLSPDRLKICKKVFHDLYDRYSSQLNYYLPPDFKTSWLKETKLNDNEHKVSSEVKCSFIKSNQNQNRKSELSNNISVPSTNHDKMVNNQPDSLEDLTSKNENTIDKSSKNIIISESSSSKNLLDDNSPKKNLPEFSDSRLRLNKVIGFAANASIEKLNKSDASIPRAELTTQIFNDIVKQKNNPVLYKDMLKGINMDDIDVNYVKEVIEGIKKASCVEPVQPPPLPPSDLMDLGTSTINLISTTEQNPHKIVTPDNILSSKSTSINRPPSDTELNTLHKTGSSNDTSQKFISALKPGTLIDLVNSKVSRTSLHIESLRPVIKANGKSNDNKISVADINVPRDPRIRNKSLLSSENSISPINTHASLVQTAFSTNSPHLFASNIDNSNSIFETKAQEISGYNGLSLPNHTNNQLLNLPFPSEHNVGGSILFKNRPLSQNQNRQNRNDFNQFSNSSQIHVTPSHSEPMVKYCDPVPYKSHSNDTISKRDPRSFKNIPVTNRVQFPNYKEYREAKYGKEQNKSFEKNKQMNQVHEKIEKNNIIDSSYNTFGIVNETANIKGFKIPKIKHNGDLVDNSSVKDSKTKVVESNKNNADILNTEKIVKVPKKTNHFYHALKQCTVDGQKTEIIKSNDSKKDTKKTEKINNSHTDKNMEIKITENSNTDRNLQMKTAVINKPDKDESCPDINLEKITVNIPSKVDDKDKLPKFEQNDNLIEPTKHNKPKKPKKYSKEKEFEKIVKEAVENSYNDACGPRTRTRCSLLKNKETLKTSKVNNSKPMFEKKSSSKNNKKLEFGECSKNLDDNLSIPSMIDVSESVEIGHNIISSTSKEQSEVVNSTTNEILCKSQEENIVSSNEINSTADNPKINEKVLIDILKNPKFMTVISLFQDENKLEKLNKLLESSIVGSNDDKLNKNISNEEQLDIDRQKKIKRKMKKEKKKQRKMKKILGEESSNEESLNDISDDNNFNQAENIVITKKKKNMNELDEGNTNSGNILGYSSTEQHKLKSVKRKISNESYGNFEILKDKCKPELKDLKIVIAKFDKNIKRKENCSSDITSTSNDRLTNNEPINVVKAQKIKPKKPFLGPLSVKLARQKMEIKQNNSKKSLNNKNQFNFKTKTSEKGFSSFSSDYKKNGKLLTDTLNSMMNEQPVVILHPLINPEAYDEVVFNKSVVQNPNTSTVIEPNVNVNKPELKKARLSELDKLHADISEMFDCDAVLNASNIRQCRTNKQIDYVNTSVAPSKKKKASNIEQLDCNDDQNKLICGIEKPKNTKKKVKKSTLKLNTKNKCVKESMANKTLPSIIVKTAVSKKVSDKEPSKLKKKKKENKKSKKSNNQLNNFINNVVLNDESELNNLSSNKISTEVMPKVLSENEFKDKSYFQTTDNILECKFCNYKDKGLNIVRHYKDQHRGEEVLPSRLPKNCTELLIHQSIKENFGHQNSQDSKPFCLGSVNVNYTCVFCQVIFHDYFKFHDHITGHTGEYRFKCKMCDQIYSNEDELDKHILEHTDYDKTNGISHLIYPNPMWSKIVFGYLCSFCYYVQLNYKNMVKHMTSRHFYEDKKLNGHWTVIRISMSMADKNYIDSLINLNNLVGCLPPTQADQVISKYNDNEDQNQQLTVRDINILPKEQMQLDSVLSIKKESNRQNINAIPPVSIIDENSSELSIFENPPDLTIENNSAKLTVVETPSESNVDENLPKERIQLDTILSIKKESIREDINTIPPETIIDESSSELSIFENPPDLTIDNNSAKLTVVETPSESKVDENLSDLAIDNNSPNLTIVETPIESNFDENLPKERIQLDTILSIKKESIREDINTIPPESIIDESSSELSIFENPPDLTIDNNSPNLTIVETPIESNVDENLPKERIQLDTILSIKKESIREDINTIPPESIIDESSSELSIFENPPDLTIDNNSAKLAVVKTPSESKVDENLPKSVIVMNPLQSVINKNQSKSNTFKLFPEQAFQSLTNETKISTEESGLLNSEYTLKENSTKCALAGLSCELINSILLFKCSVLNCLENQFSTVVLIDFFKHINQNHQLVVWDGKCETCHDNFKLISKQYYVKNALEHLISHHLVLKNNEQPNHMMNFGGSKSDQSLSSVCQNMFKNTPIVEKLIRVRCSRLPGDSLSTRKTSMTSEEKSNLFEDSRLFDLKNDLTEGIIGNVSCKKINNMLLFQCIDESCPNTCSTIIYNDFVKHIQSYHKLTSWNGMCSICGCGFWRNYNYLYMENALEHLVSCHLIECQKSVHTNYKPSDSSISNICDMPVNNPPNDDTNSINKNDFIKHNVFENSEQSSHMLLSNQCDETSVNLNINHGSNDGRFPLSSCNFDVENLKKDKVNALKIISSASGNNDLNMWMKTKTSCELVPPSSEISLEAGQQIVNNGIPIDSTIYLIDTTYTKDYDKKVRDLPMNVMKTKLAFNEMSALPRLLGLFKCMDRTCTKIFNSKELFKLHMKLHFSNTEKKKKNQIYNVEQFKMCAYCFKMFDDEESLANHIVDNYTFCEYFCPYCFYRAYTASHVLVHQSIIHTKISKHSIIKLEYNDDACKYPKEMLMVVDFKDFVLPYKCSVGYCAFSCYLHNEFIDHLNEEHQLCDKFCCYICDNKDDGEGFFALQSNLMITHFKLHNLNKYQCIFCLFGCEIIDSMIKHLAFEHFEYEPLCLERSTVSDNCDSKNIKNLKILKLKKVIENGMIEVVNLPVDTVSSLPEVLPQKSKKRSVECSDVLSVAMKSACIDEGSQPLDTIVITVPDSAQMAESSTSLPLAIDNEFIMIDDVNENDMQESLKINCIWSESKNKEKRKVSSNNDVIVIDDEDETNLLEKEELESPKKRMCLEKGESTNGSIKVKRLAFPIIELDKLFVCKECEKIFSNGDIYHAHLNVCPFWDSVAGQKCMYCVKVFKTPLNMSEHIKLHGPDRFKCYLCSLNVPSQRAITHHMKNSHGITNLDFVPERSNLTDLNKDNFIVYENKIVEQKKQKIHNLFSCNKCSFKGNSRKIIMSHMKAVHNTEQNLDFDGKFYKTMQELPNDVNNSDNSLIPQQNKQQITTLKRKRSTNFGYQKGLPKTKHLIKDKTKNLCFSPDTIDSIPKSHIFSDLIGCSLCTYNTKVRSNLILHLNGHIKGQDNTTKEIVNPVPSIGKSELMFDKMINLSASSFDAMNTDKMKRDELDKKIVEVAPDDNFKTDVFPQFVPESKRYKCSIPLCDHICMTEEMLKTHISILHSDYQCYICPHCQPSCIISKTVERNQIEFHLMHHGENLYKCQYCEYIDFNRVEMKTHMRNTHLSEITNSVQSNIIVIRQTMLKDSCIDRGRSKAPSNVPQWVCNICSTGLRYTENEITSHIFMAHKVSSMYKCPMCQFENKDDNASTFEEHYKLKHPSVAVKCLRVFEMITDKEELHQQRSGGAENILEQQALESIEPTLVPPTCRGIPIESTPLKINNKPRGMSKSPKSATKSSSIQAHKQKMLIDVFNKNDKLGEISSNGFFVCPKCNKFEISSIELFREHLYKEINYKTWKCLKCFEISDSPKKMAWHVKKHGIGSKYEKIEDEEKLKWVNRVIGHQHFLLTEFNKNSKEKRVKSVETNKSVVNNKKTSYSPVKKKNIEREKKVVFISQPNPDPVLNDNIINLVDDSDDE